MKRRIKNKEEDETMKTILWIISIIACPWIGIPCFLISQAKDKKAKEREINIRNEYEAKLKTAYSDTKRNS